MEDPEVVRAVTAACAARIQYWTEQTSGEFLEVLRQCGFIVIPATRLQIKNRQLEMKDGVVAAQDRVIEIAELGLREMLDALKTLIGQAGEGMSYGARIDKATLAIANAERALAGSHSTPCRSPAKLLPAADFARCR